MLIIYHSYGGVGALAAAALHLARISPAAAQVLPRLDLLPAPAGNGGGPGLHFQGTDGGGHTVYALARNVPPGVIDRAFLGVASVFKRPITDYLLVDAGLPGEKSVFWLAWTLCHAGRPGRAQRLLTRSIRWPLLAEIVERTRERLTLLQGAAQGR